MNSHSLHKWWSTHKFAVYGLSLSLPLLVFVVAVPQRVCPSKLTPLRKSKQLAGECHRSSGLLVLCCVLMCVSAGQWVIMCVRPWVPVLQCVQTLSTESSILFR